MTRTIRWRSSERAARVLRAASRCVEGVNHLDESPWAVRPVTGDADQRKINEWRERQARTVV